MGDCMYFLDVSVIKGKGEQEIRIETHDCH